MGIEVMERQKEEDFKIKRVLGLSPEETEAKIYNILNEDYLPKLLSNISQGKYYLDLDFNSVSAEDPKLANDLLDSQSYFLEAFGNIAKKLADTEHKIKIRLFNLPESEYLPLNQVSDQMDKLMKFRGVVSRITEKMGDTSSYSLRCKACGKEVNDIRTSEFECPNCSKDMSVIESKDIIYRNIYIDEDKPADINRATIRKDVLLEEDLAKSGSDDLCLGSQIEVTGTLRKIPIPKSKTKFKLGIHAQHIKKLDASWKAIKLTEEDMVKINSMSKEPNLLRNFALSLATQFHGYEEIRESLILSQVEGKRIIDKNNVLMQRRTIHILMIGSPSAGKSQLLRRIGKLCPFAPSTSGKGNTGVGLVAAVTQDKLGGWVCDSGPIIRADMSCCLIDELEKMNKSDFGNLNNVMAEEFVEINKANIHERFNTRTSILSTANPIHQRFVLEEPIHKQIGLPKDFIDRFDFIWPMEVQDQDKVMDKMLTIHLKEEEQPIGKYTFVEMRNYIASCREIIPEVDYNLLNYFKLKWNDLTGKGMADENNVGKSNRLIENIFRLCYAHCKFYRRTKMTKEDIDYSFDLFRKNFEMLQWIDKTSGLVSYEKVESLPTKEEIKKDLTVKDILNGLKNQYSNNIPFEVAIAKCKEHGIDEAKFEEALEKYKRSGDIYEPRSGKIISII